MVKTNAVYVPFPKHMGKGCPKGKVPYARGGFLGNDEFIGDSSIIIQKWSQAHPQSTKLADSTLTEEQHAVGVAFRTMLEESTYWSGTIETRWRDPKVFKKHTIPTYFGDFTGPPFLKNFAAWILRKRMLKQYYQQGIGRHAPEEVRHKCLHELRSTSAYLGKKKYFMGNELTSFDATVYGYIAPLMQGPWDHPICVSVQTEKEFENLRAFVARMRREFWPGLQKQK